MKVLAMQFYCLLLTHFDINISSAPEPSSSRYLQNKCKRLERWHVTAGATASEDLSNKSPLWYIFMKEAKKKKEYAITP
jgi:hypothetical protein